MRTKNEVRELLREIKIENLAGCKMPGDERQKKLRRLLKDIEEGNIEYNALYSTIHTFGEARFYEAEPLVEQFLKHEDPNLRNIALNVLGIHWDSRKHGKVFESFLFDEKEDEENRAMAASCLGYITRGTKDKAALRILLSFFKDEEVDEFIRDRSYHGILNIWGISFKDRPSSAKELNYERDVDWKMIHEIENYLEN